MEILIVSVVVLFVFCIFLVYRDFKIRKIIFDLNKPLRKGYYKYGLKVTSKLPNVADYPFYPLVYVIELDRYTSGESKIKLDYIDPCISEIEMSHDTIKTFIKNKFETVVKTADINWLESELSIKEMRREKLDKLKKLKFK